MADGQIEHVATRELKPPPFNTRTSFDESKMENLVESIRSGGIHEPIIGRRVNGHIEIVAGERRWRAAKTAKLETVPVILRQLSDAEALEVQLIENEQREDVSPLDQAAGFRKLMDLDPANYTAETLATRIGLKPASVYLRLKLLALTDDAKQLYREGVIDAGHAVLIARLAANDQAKAVDYARKQHKSYGHVSVREMKRWIGSNIKIDLFGPAVAEEQPKVAAKLQKFKEKGVEVAELSRNWMDPEASKKTGVLGYNDYREAGKKKCDHIRPGAFVYADGDREGLELTEVCTTKDCKVHWPEVARQKRERAAAKRQAKEDPKAREKRLKAEADAKAKRQIEDALQGRVVLQILKTVKSVSKPVLAALVHSQLGATSGAQFDEELKELGLEGYATAFGASGLAKVAKATDRQLAQLAVFGLISDRVEYDLPAVCKEWGVNLKKLEKELLQTAAPAKGAKPEDLKGVKKQIDRQAAKRSKKR